jgi:serine/threonine protein kinase
MTADRTEELPSKGSQPSPSADTLSQATPVSADAATITHSGASPAPDLGRVGTIPGYQILGELGRGGMGVVYHARETALNRPVALKVLLAGSHAGARDLARFRAEAEAAAAIQHANVVQVYAIGQHGGLPFMAQELVPGGSLAARLATGPLMPSDAARVVQGIARGVQAAHDRGVVHRDLKPANVLFGPTGEPKVADFGLAKLGDTGLTASGAIMGTPAYMSPEQARGDTKAAGPPADIWALGAILYECLAGRPPFKGQSAPDTLRLVCETEPESIRRTARSIPKDLETIALKCLEKEPSRRYSSAGAMADDLAHYLAGEPVSARPRGRVASLARWTGRHKGPVYVAAGALLAAVVTLVALSLKSKPPEPSPAANAKLPPDLAMIPSDAFAFMTFGQSEVRDRREFMNILARLQPQADQVPTDPEEIDNLIEETIGVRPADVERITLAVRSHGFLEGQKKPEFLIVLRTKTPANLKPIRDAIETMFGSLQPQEHRGRRLYAVKSEQTPFALYRASERELVFGWITEVEAAIDRQLDGPIEGPLSPALAAAAEGHTLVLGARDPTKLIGLLGPGLGREVKDAVELLRDAGLTVVTLDLLPATTECQLPGVDLNARFQFSDEARAAQAMLEIRDTFRQLGEPDPHPANAGPAALLPALQKAAREAQVRQDGSEVIVSGGPRWTAADLVAAAKRPVPSQGKKLRQIGMALYTYCDIHGHFPPAVIKSPTGKPLYSWRVELLPLLEHDDLYRKLNRKEAWDHPDNKALLEKVPEVYSMSPDDMANTAAGTRFQALVGKGGVFDETTKTKFADITDGTSNTLLLVESGEPVHWAEPRDVAYAAGGPVPKLGVPAADTFLVLMADSSTLFLRRALLRPEDLTALFTRNGGEVLNLERLERARRGR